MNFVTEDSIEEERKKRQAEWEKVRKPSDPIEAPTDNSDNRTLYEKLKEQHEIKKRDFEDQFALSLFFFFPYSLSLLITKYSI
jgi:hypothetical protein